MNTRIVIPIGAIFLVIIIAFFIWKVERKINYKIGYKKMVEQTILEMVKKEALK